MNAPCPPGQVIGPLNVADHLRRVAAERPRAHAVVRPGPRDGSGRRAYFHLTFAELDASIDRYARGLQALGVRPGARVLMMVRPSFEFFALTFALFRMGAVPVMIDPGMGKDNVLSAIREVEPEVLLAIPKAHVVRLLFPRAFASVQLAVTVGRRLFWGGHTLREVEELGSRSSKDPSCSTDARDTAAILFTSGSTGAPKGVLYSHAVFEEQVRIFREELGITPGEVDLSAFPLFSLFSLALGVTVVVPDMDATRPAKVRPELIAESIRDLGVTYAFGSPAFWRRITEWCRGRDRLASAGGPASPARDPMSGTVRFPTLKRILMAGAPAPVQLLERLVRIVPDDAGVFTPYGATECLPITMPSARDLLAGPARQTALGAGTCVGAPLGHTRVEIIGIDDGPISGFDGARRLPAGEIGEILVAGPVTTQQYFRRPDDDARSKVAAGDGSFWHRMGDVGYLDEQGRLWFCGRKAHRVETAGGPMYTERVEALFNNHPSVRRSALVGAGERGRQRPIIIIELEPRARALDRTVLARELLELAARSPLTAPIRDVLFHPSFPVDPRHNAKIIREQLAVWAVRELRW